MHLLLQALLASALVVAPPVLIDVRRRTTTRSLLGCVGVAFLWPASAVICGLLFGAAEQAWAAPVLGFAGPWRAPVVGAAAAGLLQLVRPVRSSSRNDSKDFTIEPVLVPLIVMAMGGAIGLVWIVAGRLLDLAGI